jgi:hypothetical protein
MNSKFSRWLLIAEAVLFAAPLTALLVLGISAISLTANDAFWPWIAADLITAFAALAVVAGWWLIVKGIRGGAESLRGAHWAWWLSALVGVILVVAGASSMLLAPAPEYSHEAFFREQLELCVLASPLVAVLGHLWAEAKLRKPARDIHRATRDPEG